MSSTEALELRCILDVLGSPENSFSLSWRGKNTKCQLLKLEREKRRIFAFIVSIL
jgi:hypothetical protein